MKKFILLLVLLWTLLIVKSAGSHEPLGDYSEQFVEAHNSPNLPRGEAFNPCSCVSYYKFKMGISQTISVGNAKDILPWYLEPQDSGMIVTYEGGGHVAYYEKEDNFLRIFEANFIPCEVSTRVIPINHPLIRGFR